MNRLHIKITETEQNKQDKQPEVDNNFQDIKTINEIKATKECLGQKKYISATDNFIVGEKFIRATAGTITKKQLCLVPCLNLNCF